MNQIEELIKQMKVQAPPKNVCASQNVNLLKTISQYPENISPPRWNYYIEPIEVEFFAPKVGNFVQLEKYLFIELYDPIVEKEKHLKIHEYFKKKNRPITIIEVMDVFPEYMIPILNYYGELMGFHEKVAFETLEGMGGNLDSMCKALYLTEVLRKKEPTLATFEILGDYVRYNLNWYIRYLNQKKVKFYLEDTTVYYLMNIYLREKEKKGEIIDKRFYILREIYLEQACYSVDGDDDDE